MRAVRLDSAATIKGKCLPASGGELLHRDPLVERMLRIEQ